MRRIITVFWAGNKFGRFPGYPIIIGNWEYPSCHGMHFGGAIDEVRIYNYARKP